MENINSGNNVRNSPILVCEHVKCRSVQQEKSNRSAVGSLFIHTDRIVWKCLETEKTIQVPLSKIKGQRISTAAKMKIQLQLVLNEDDCEPVTFTFIEYSQKSPAENRLVLTKQRDLVKETIQNLLLNHQAVQNDSAMTLKINQSNRSNEMELKQTLLREKPQMQDLYKSLVKTGLITPDQFWSEHLPQAKSSEVLEQRTGVPGSLLSNFTQMDGCNGIKLNLSADTIQAIFQTYPSVKRKHLDLVPHEMTEEEFWRQFYQSHYFHRDRAANLPPNELFSDCLKYDQSDMRAMCEAGVCRVDLSNFRDVGLSGLRDDDGDVSVKVNDDSKSSLIKQFNYHSGRVLSSFLGTSDQTVEPLSNLFDSFIQPCHSADSPNLSNDPSSSRKAKRNADFILHNTDSTGDSKEMKAQPLHIAHKSLCLSDNVNSAMQGDAFRAATLRALAFDGEKCLIDDQCAQRALFVDCGKGNRLSNNDCFQRRKLNGILSLHYSLLELLRHFWSCFPPKTVQMEQKLDRMIETLHKFESTRLRLSADLYGQSNITHFYAMLTTAYTKYKQYREKRKS